MQITWFYCPPSLFLLLCCNELMKTSHLFNVNFYTYLALYTNLKAVSAFLDWCICDSYICGRKSEMAWHCFHLKFMGAIHLKFMGAIHLKFMGAIHFKNITELNGHTVQLLLTKVTLTYYFQYSPMNMAYFWRVMSERHCDEPWQSI